MNIVIAQGGLGNIMFQYAFCCSLNDHFRNKCILFISKMSLHHGCEKDELMRIFSINRLHNLNIIEKGYVALLESLREKKIPYKLLLFPKKAIRQDGFSYNNIFEERIISNSYFIGGWQSENYFFPIKDNIQKIFHFNKSIMNSKTNELCILMNKTNSVSIHIRRGDYMSPFYSKEASVGCTINYYKKAIKLIHKRIVAPIFYVFSDDIEYAKEIILAENVHFINHNLGMDSWQDMYLISQCQHNIIANSTFSWWGAYLNSNINKIVIAPEVWWYGYDTKYVIPEDWIKLSPE